MPKVSLIVVSSLFIGIFGWFLSFCPTWASFTSQVNIAGNTIETRNYGTLQSPKPTKIGFWYNFQTSENLAGFGEPAFVVKLNNEVVHQVWANDAQRQTAENLRETGQR